MSVQTQKEVIEDHRRLAKINEHLDEFKIIRGCEWARKKNEISLSPSLSQFLGKKKIKECEIMNAVKDGSFFGLLKVCINTPTDVIEKYKRMNFPFIFRRATIDEDMLSEAMKKNAREQNKVFPQSCLTLAWNVTDMVIASPLLRFYMELGMKAHSLSWAIQYIEGSPFSKFVEEMVEIRIGAYGNNGPLGDRAKFTLNSCVGRFG